MAIYLRGCAMGAADLVPGVSGGTIALITGIYERLITAIANIDIYAIKHLLRLDLKAAWKHVDATFLLVLASGILTSIFTLANLIDYLVKSQPILIWSFFSGLVLASILFLLRMVRPRTLVYLAFVALGAIFAMAFSLVRGAEMPAVGFFVYIGGFIAISAMMLPGISGSFLLLMLGLYQPTLEAVISLNLAYLSIFALGAASGFVIFSRVIRYLLQHFHDLTLLFLTGLLVGSLHTTWPWKAGFEEGAPANLWPSSYAQQVAEPQIGLAVAALVFGFLLVLVISIAGSKKDAITQSN